MRSASYSRLRLIAICTSEAASGARIIAAMATIGFISGRPFSSRPPPIRPPNVASMPIAPDERGGDGHGERVAVADMAELVRHHAGDLLAAEVRSRPVVAATAACSGLRPVAKALGWSSSMT